MDLIFLNKESSTEIIYINISRKDLFYISAITLDIIVGSSGVNSCNFS